MKKIFISQAMRGLSDEQIVEVRELIKREFSVTFGDYEYIESYLPELRHASPIDALSASLSLLADADILLAPMYNRDQLIAGTSVCNVFQVRVKGVEFETLIAHNYNLTTVFYQVSEKKDKVMFEFRTQ